MTDDDRDEHDGADAAPDDEFDDDYDNYEDYDFEDDRPASQGAAKGRRDTWLLAGAAVVIIAIAVAVIVFKGDDKKSTSSPSTDSVTAPVPVTDSTPEKKPPQWPDDATHPPKGLEGNGMPSPGAAPLAPGVYFWYAYNWHVVVAPGDGIGPLSIGVKDTNAPPDPAKQVDVKLIGAAPPGVTATNEAKGSLKLIVAPGTGNTLLDLDVNGFVGSLTWTFDGVDPNLVHLGTSPAPIPASPYIVTKQQFNK